MELNGKKRQEKGKKVKGIRTSGGLPGVVFGVGIESTPIDLSYNDFVKVFSQAGETTLIDLKLDGDKAHKVLVKDVQVHPVKSNLLHVSFYKPNLMEKIEVQVPVEVIGEESNPLLKSGEGVLLVLMNEITVKTLPTDIPHAFTIDISNLVNVGDSIAISQLDYNREIVEIMDLDEEELVIKMDYAQMQETESEISEEEAIANVEAIEETKPEDAEDKDSDK